MDNRVKKDILRVLKSTLNCIENKACSAIESLSNQVIHDASIFQDEHSTSVAIIVYSLYKIIERNPKINKLIIKEMHYAIDNLEQNYFDRFNQNLKQLMNLIETEDSKLKYYFKDILDKAKVSKGAKIYDHGISIARVSEILGRSQWEMTSYIGKTNINDSFELRSDVTKRLNFARSLFMGGSK